MICFHSFNVPEELKSKYAFSQFYTFTLTLDGKEIAVPILICSSWKVNYVSQ
jgi:hypothetical protein